jgi:uncharacterized protein (DUF433 family)
MQLEEYFDFLGPDDIRIKGHRIGIDDVLELYLEGYSAEEIAAHFPTLRLVEIYATLTYYHQHRAEVDAYLARLAEWRTQHEREEEAKEVPAVVQRLRTLKAQRRAERLSA